MGNEICCQQPATQQHKEKVYTLTPQTLDVINSKKWQSTKQEDLGPQITLPILPHQIQKVLNQHRPFERQFSNQVDIKTVQFGNDIYVGPLNKSKVPTAIGKMYKQNGAYYIGHFVHGKAEGPGFYVLKDGSYFDGQMSYNKVECQKGTYVSKDIQYFGGFKNNQFHGKGSEKGLNQVYMFEGVYGRGKKIQGVMKWGKNTYENIYEGKFNLNGQFTGKGKLTDPEGVYEGDFVNGQKHGYGVYSYNNQLRYEGQYKNNKKEGEGKIINMDESIAYKGIFKNGLPNGKGVAISKFGQQFETEWVDGIDSRLL